MAEKIKKLFLFLIPTLIVGLVFVFIQTNQQNFSAADDSNFLIISIEQPEKKIVRNVLASNYFFIFGQNIFLFLLTIIGSVYFYVLAQNYFAIIFTIKNRSPPHKTSAII